MLLKLIHLYKILWNFSQTNINVFCYVDFSLTIAITLYNNHYLQVVGMTVNWRGSNFEALGSVEYCNILALDRAVN